MKKNWKILLPTLLFVVFAFTACGGGGETPPPTAAPVGGGNGGADAPADAPPATVDVDLGPPERDLGGFEINIATWFEENCTRTVEPTTASERVRWDHRRAMEERYNFTMRYVRAGTWHEYRDNVLTDILAGNRAHQIWVLEPGWFSTGHNQGLFAPIPLSHFDDPFGITWNRSILDNSMRNGLPHAFASGLEMGGGVYFNMRLLEEAGHDRYLPFQLQEAGDWTWDTFTNLARTLSIDHDDDGIIDTFAISTFHTEFLAHALASNNATFTSVDPETGRYVNATNTDNFRDAIEWMVQLRQERLSLHEEDVGGQWDAFVDVFNRGDGAMRIGGVYLAGNIFPVLEDPFGFVAFPRGPRVDSGHTAWVSQDFNAIPHFYTEEEVDKIMFAFQRWVQPLEDDDPDDWVVDALDNHHAMESVLETMMNFSRNPEYHVMPAHLLLPINQHALDDLFAWRVWVDGNDPSVIVEEGSLQWQAILDDINAQMN